MEPRKVTIILDKETLDRVALVRKRLGFYKMSEAFRFIINKGLDAVEAEVEAR